MHVSAGFRIIAACSVFTGIFGTPARADAPLDPAFTEQWRVTPGLHLFGPGRIAVADLDGDELPEFVVSGSNYYGGSNALLVVGASSGTASIKQAIILPDDPAIPVKRVLAASIAGTIHVFSIVADGTVRDFSGWPLVEKQHYSVAANVTSAAFGDLAGDGQMRLIVGTSDGLHAYDALTGVPLWDFPLEGVSDVALAQLDDDNALEVIASPGVVIDGATQAIDWQYIDGFGLTMATGHLLGDASTQFVGSFGDHFIVFRAVPWSPLWSTGMDYQTIGVIVTANLDHNDRDVIVTAASQFGYINAYNSSDHQLRFTVPGFAWSVSALATASFFDAGASDLIIAGTPWTGDANLHIVDIGTGQTRWSYTPWSGILSPVAIADVDGDGRDEVVVAGSEPSGDNGTIAIFDALTGALKWKAPDPSGNAADPFYLSTSKILLVPHSVDKAMDVVLAGTSSNDGRITVFDGATHSVRLQIGSYASGPMGSRYLMDAALVDFDGTPDYAAVTKPASTDASGALLQVFSGINGSLLWSSDPLGSGFIDVDNVLVTGPRSDPASELIEVLPWTMRAFNLQTQTVDWNLFAPSDGAFYAPHGLAGPEIVTFLNGGAVAFYDAATREYLRGFTLDAPLAALVAPGGDSHRLVAASGNALRLLDGTNGDVLASSEFLGANLGLHNQLAVRAGSSFTWDVASGTDFAVFRHRLDLSDQVFTTGFEEVVLANTAISH